MYSQAKQNREYKSDRQKYCSGCDAVIVSHADYCPRCGQQQPVFGQSGFEFTAENPTTRPNKSYFITGLLALTIGGVGAHRFYLGQRKLALAYLLLSVTGIPSFVAFIEGVYILVNRKMLF